MYITCMDTGNLAQPRAQSVDGGIYIETYMYM